MNEIALVGNLTDDPELRYAKGMPSSREREPTESEGGTIMKQAIAPPRVYTPSV